MYIGSELQIAIAAVFTALTGFGGWLFRALWTGREDAWKMVVGVTTDFLKETALRQKLWDDLKSVIETNTKEIADLKRQVQELTNEIRRLKP